MKNVTFSEKNDIERVISSGEVTQDNVGRVISSFAKYNFSILHMDDDANFNTISKWLKKHYNGYVETEFFDIIRGKIDAAHKYNLLESRDLVVYKSELDTIVNTNDIKIEKVLFAVLCVAKLQKNILGYQNGKYVFSLTNIFKLARVHIRSTEREMFMHQLHKLGFIDAPYRNNDDSRWVTFMSDGTDDEAVLTINAIDFQELAFVYEQWKDGGGFTRCKRCGRLMKNKKKDLTSKAKNIKKYCELCAIEVEKENSKERVRRFRDKCNGN